MSARTPRQRKPVTAADVEQMLDKLAWVMSKSGSDASLAAPLWRRLETELARLREEEAIVAAASARLRDARATAETSDASAGGAR